MPIYEYEDIKTGKLIELPRPVRLRDDCPPNLKRVISRTQRPRIGHAKDPSEAAQSVPKALRQVEEQIGTTELTRQTGFTPKQMRKIWNIN